MYTCLNLVPAGVKVTVTNGNASNGIRGSRVRVRRANGVLVDEFTLPTRSAYRYLSRYPFGKHGARFIYALADAVR